MTKAKKSGNHLNKKTAIPKGKDAKGGIESPEEKLADIIVNFGKIVPPSGNDGILREEQDGKKAEVVEKNLKVDPVCKMRGKFAIKKNHKGKDYWFCSGGCEWMFIKDPENFE